MHTSELLNKQLNLIDKTKGIEKANHQYELGLWYEQGLHTLSERSDLAIIWYKRAAKNGNLEAHYKLAIAYANGTHRLEKRLDLAVRWFEKASEKGHPEAQRTLSEAQYNLASAYAYGRHGFEENPELSVLYYQKAAKNGHIEAQSRLPNAHYELAGMLQHGKCGVKKNIERSIYYYKLASGNGIPEASYNLGLIYKGGEGVPLEEQGQAIQNALYYFKQAAHQGDKDALSQIEQIYVEGLAQRPEPPKPVVKPTSVPPGFNRQDRRKNSQTVIRKDDGTLNLEVEGRITVLQVAEHQPNAEASVLTPGFDHYQRNDTYGNLRTEFQKENRQENPPSTRVQLPGIPIFQK